MVNKMTVAANRFLVPASAVLLLACAGLAIAQEDAILSAEEKAAASVDAPVSPGGPVRIKHELVSTPVVGQPLLIDLSFESRGDPRPMRVDYRINDSTALQFPEQQVQTATVTPDASTRTSTQQVTVIPQREGRLYLNVSVGVESELGSSSTVMAIPIQVGEGPRSFESNGTLTTDTDGDAVRSLPARTE
jgi:hypothetical protein